MPAAMDVGVDSNLSLTTSRSPNTFAGDLYGTQYSAADFEWDEEPLVGREDGQDDELGPEDSNPEDRNMPFDGLPPLLDCDSDSDSDSDSENPDDDLEDGPTGWEAPRPPIPSDEVANHEHNAPDAPDSRATSSTTPNVDANSRSRFETALRDSIHVRHFPSETAGRVITQPSHHATTHYRAYEARLRQPQQSADGEVNIYTPLASKLDWDIARWAKLRGPGSTSVSELLSIDGVSQISGSLLIQGLADLGYGTTITGSAAVRIVIQEYPRIKQDY